MMHVENTVEVPYSMTQMFDLINDVNRYPEFVPFCSKGSVAPTRDDQVEASLEFSSLKITEAFTTLNTFERPHTIGIQLVNGPFKELRGNWQLAPGEKEQTKMTLSLEFEIASVLLQQLTKPFINTIVQQGMNAFVKRADELYGIQAA